ncbi:MAG: hypothetical protein ABR867_03995 [Nitrososphaerales archaeon]
MRQRTRAVDGLFDISTVFWGALFGAFFRYAPDLARKGWMRMSAGQQYILASLGFMGMLLLPVCATFYVLSGYIGFDAWLLAVPVTMMLSPPKTKDNEDNFIQRFQYKHFTVRLLWRDLRTRTCKKCGYYDNSTRDITGRSVLSQPISEPCRECGGTDFQLHMLDYPEA